MPTQYRRKVFAVMHSLAHLGRKATQKLISDKFVCHNLNKDVNQWAKQCLSCQSSKIQKHVHAPLDTFVVPEKRFIHINIDIVGHLHQSVGFTYLLTIVDRTTRWSEAAPNDTVYKRWSCHSEFKLLCKLCRTSQPPAMGARFTVFGHAGHADPLDGWRCCSQNNNNNNIYLKSDIHKMFNRLYIKTYTNNITEIHV